MKTPFALPLLIISLLIPSCTSYLIKENETISKSKRPGIILRISRGSKISKEELIRNNLYWLSNFEKSENITLIAETSDSLGYFSYAQERFYQLSSKGKYLKYKSIGILNLYLQNNRTELLSIMSKNNLDSLIIFEIYNIISTEMQFLDYDSVVALVDSNLNIGYMDHSTDHVDSESSILFELKNQMMDKLNENLIASLQGLNILGNRTEKANIVKISSLTEPNQEINEQKIITEEETETQEADIEEEDRDY
jgi:hypothetical protein